MEFTRNGVPCTQSNEIDRLDAAPVYASINSPNMRFSAGSCSGPLESCLAASRTLGILLTVLTLTLLYPAFSAAQSRELPAAAQSALDRAQRLGRLGVKSYEQLRDQFGAGSRARILVHVASPDEPLARLPGQQARNPATQASRQAAISRAQARLLSRPGLGALRGVKTFRHVPWIALEVDADQLSRLIRFPEVVEISSDEPLKPVLQQTVLQIGADLTWLQGYSGNGQVVAVLDTGLDSGHLAFAGRIVNEACFSTNSTVENTSTLCPNGQDSQIGSGAAASCVGLTGCDHGTHVAGIAAGDDANFRGVAPNSGLLPIQVFSRQNGFFACNFAPPCLSALTSDVVRALEHVYDLRDVYPIAAVNMSLGGETYSNAAACDAAYPAIKAALDNLRSVDITPVAASGNSGVTDGLSTPSCITGMVSVGAVDAFDEVAFFSNSAHYLDTLAPGVNIISTLPGNSFGANSGTSMATPVISGALAVLRDADPDSSPEELLHALRVSGVSVADTRNGIVTPRLQLDAAMELLTDGDLTRISLSLVPEIVGLDEPVGVAHAGDGSGRLYIMQRAGTVLMRDTDGLASTPFLDVSSRVTCCADDGLLGLAFHPQYSATGHVFVSYLTDSGDIVVERYTLSGYSDQIDPNSALEIIRINSSIEGHHGGRLHFGHDGYLYIATGDAALDGTVAVTGGSDDPGNLLGKMLRIDVDAVGVPYAIPPDNPLSGMPGTRGEIWALGLRDPRRFSFDSLSGDMYIADVGEDDAHEVNVLSVNSIGGEHYGWPTMEGSQCRNNRACDPSGFILPVVEYATTQGCEVTGGVVYRETNHADLYGAYLFGDSCSGRIWGLRTQAGQWQQALIAQTDVLISAFGSDQSGAAFLVDQSAGQVYRLITSDLTISTVQLPLALLGRGYHETLSTAGGAAPYQWTVIDGSLPAGFTLDQSSGVVSGNPLNPQSAVFTVQVQDAEFAIASRTLRITAVQPPLTFDTEILTAAATGSSYTTALMASGGALPYTWAVSGGSPPSGITLDAAGTLSGTPTVAGDFSFSVTVNGDDGARVTRLLQLTVFGPEVSIALNSRDPYAYGNGYGSNEHVRGLLATFTGTSTDLILQVRGFDVDFADELRVSLNGNLLGYLSAGPNGALNAGDVFDIPAGAQIPGVNQLRITVKTAGWIWGVTDLLLTDATEVLTITTAALPDATVSESYASVLQATGGAGAYAWSLQEGVLPAGVTLSDNGSLAGTPGEQGLFAFTARVTDVAGVWRDHLLTLQVVGASGFIEVMLQPDVVDTGAYGYNYGESLHQNALVATFIGTQAGLALSVTGFDVDFADEVSVSLNGNRIGYLGIGANNALNGGNSFVIAASAQLPGVNQLRFEQRTSGWTWGVTDLLLTDKLPITIESKSLRETAVGAAYDVILVAAHGAGPYMWSVSDGALAPGITLNADGVLSGTPTSRGSFNFTVTVTDADGAQATRSLQLRVYGPLVSLALNNSNAGSYGNGYGSNEHALGLIATFGGTGSDLTLHVTGFDMDFADELQVTLNGDPLGYLSAGPDNGLNGGDVLVIPESVQQPGANEIRFRVKTAGWIWGVTNLLISDAPAPLSIGTTALPDTTTDHDLNVHLEAEGGVAPFTWTISSGALPLGTALDSGGLLSGTPTEQGVFSFDITVIDNVGEQITRRLTLAVYGATVPLQVNTSDPGAFGNKYGSGEHFLGLYANFTSAGTDLILEVTGFDIDYSYELEVTLNGNRIGHLSRGPNNDLNSGDNLAIPVSAQQPGLNQIRFKVLTAGWIWGVTNLLLRD